MEPPPTDDDPDGEVVARVRAGEKQLFELLIRRHNRRLFRLTRAIVGDAGEAEEVMQTAYVNAFAALPAFAGKARFGTWLARIAIHEAMAKSRQRRRTTDRFDPAVEQLMDATRGPDDAAMSAEVLRLLERAIAQLDEPFRVVFVLRAVEQLSVGEVADVLQIEENTVKTRYFRARATLKGLLAQHAEALAPGLFDFQLARCDRVVAAVMQRLS